MTQQELVEEFKKLEPGERLALVESMLHLVQQDIVRINKTLNSPEKRPPLGLTVFPIGLTSDDYTFRREDLYEDEEEYIDG